MSPHRLEYHQKRVEGLGERLDRLHGHMQIFESIAPHHPADILAPKDGKSPLQRLRGELKFIKERNRDNLKNFEGGAEEFKTGKRGIDRNRVAAYLDKTHEQMEANYGSVENKLAEIEKKVQLKAEEIRNELKKSYAKEIYRSRNLEEEDAHTERYAGLLSPSLQEIILAKAREPIVKRYIEDFKSTPKKELGELSKRIANRFDPENALSIINMAKTEMAAELEREQRTAREKGEQKRLEISERHGRELNKMKADPSLKLLYEGGNIAAFERRGRGDGLALKDGVVSTMSAEEIKREMGSSLPEEELDLGETSLERHEQELRELDEMIKKAVGQGFEGKKTGKLPRLPEKNPNYFERIAGWADILPDDFAANVLFEKQNEVHEVLDSLHEMWHDPDAVNGFTGRFGERKFKEILEISRAINQLGQNRELIDIYLKHAKEADFEQAHTLSRAVNRLASEPKKLENFMFAIRKLGLEDALKVSGVLLSE